MGEVSSYLRRVSHRSDTLPCSVPRDVVRCNPTEDRTRIPGGDDEEHRRVDHGSSGKGNEGARSRERELTIHAASSESAMPFQRIITTAKINVSHISSRVSRSSGRRDTRRAEVGPAVFTRAEQRCIENVGENLVETYSWFWISLRWERREDPLYCLCSMPVVSWWSRRYIQSDWRVPRSSREQPVERSVETLQLNLHPSSMLIPRAMVRHRSRRSASLVYWYPWSSIRPNPEVDLSCPWKGIPRLRSLASNDVLGRRNELRSLATLDIWRTSGKPTDEQESIASARVNQSGRIAKLIIAYLSDGDVTNLERRRTAESQDRVQMMNGSRRI